MANRITWFTQPYKKSDKNIPFASFYMYDLDSLDFVRIRLELGREVYNDDKGETGIICEKGRVVIAVNNKNEKLNIQLINKNKIPCVGDTIYDFSLNYQSFHQGNTVTYSNQILPKGISAIELNLIASRCIGEKKIWTLTDRDASEETLINKLKYLIKGLSVHKTLNEIEEFTSPLANI